MLKTIATELQNMGIPYEYGEWTGELTYPYFVGEYSEFVTLTEDGKREYTFILNGFSRGRWSELEQIKEQIRGHFPTVGGFRTSTDNGSIVISYDNTITIHETDDLKRIQINLNVQEWKGF